MQTDGRMTSGAGQFRGGSEVGRVTPLVQLDTADAVDLDRLERGLALQAERVGDGRYRVTGGAGDHWVDLATPSHPRCDCGDHVWRDQVCKHILAALLREGNEHVVRALATVVSRARQGGAAAGAKVSAPAMRRAA